MSEAATKPEIQAKEKSAKQSRAQSLREKLAAVEAQAKTLRDKVREEERKERERFMSIGLLLICPGADLKLGMQRGSSLCFVFILVQNASQRIPAVIVNN